MDVFDDIVNLNKTETAKLKLINPGKIEVVRKISSSNERIIRDISAKNSVHYKQNIWKVVGNINTVSIMRGFNKMISENPIFRTNYVLDLFDCGLEITYESADAVSFPITDISKLDGKTMMCKIASFAAAEARRVYNPQKNPVIRIQGFIISDNSMAVIVSYIPELCRSISRESIGRYLFAQLKFVDGVFKSIRNSVEHLNDEIRSQNIAYWKGEVSECDKELKIPGESEEEWNTNGLGSSYKKINENLVNRVIEFARENNVSVKTVYAYVWMKILASFNSESYPSIAIVGNYGEPSVYPVWVNTGLNIRNVLNTVENKMNNASKYGFMDNKDSAGIFNNDFYRRFHMQLYFFDMDKIYEKDNWLFVNNEYFNNGIELTVRINYSRSGAFFNYIYSNKRFSNSGIEALNRSFENYLQSMCDDEVINFNTDDFVDTVKTEEEYQKELFERKVACLNDIDLFKCCDASEIFEIVNRSFIQNVTVDEELIREGEVADYIGIVVEGKIEESASDGNGLGRSLRILSKNAVFGIETLLEDNFYKRTYTVASPEAVLVWVPKNVIEEVMKKEPEIWKNILALVYERLWKMERIWMME